MLLVLIIMWALALSYCHQFGSICPWPFCKNFTLYMNVLLKPITSWFDTMINFSGGCSQAWTTWTGRSPCWWCPCCCSCLKTARSWQLKNLYILVSVSGLSRIFEDAFYIWFKDNFVMSTFECLETIYQFVLTFGVSSFFVLANQFLQ